MQEMGGGMRSRATSVVGGDAARVREQLNQWRQDHSGGGRIPEVLWTEAARLARELGLHKTARLLGLNYYGLKKRLQTESAPATDGPSSPAFVEVQPAYPSAFECVLELQNAQGTQLKLHLRGSAAPDLTALSSVFWSSAR
jgi:hypothetical protein